MIEINGSWKIMLLDSISVLVTGYSVTARETSIQLLPGNALLNSGGGSIGTADLLVLFG